jgi:hypothetical protein
VAGAAVELPAAGDQLKCAVPVRGVHLLSGELRLQVARHRGDGEESDRTVAQAYVDPVAGSQRPKPVEGRRALVVIDIPSGLADGNVGRSGGMRRGGGGGPRVVAGDDGDVGGAAVDEPASGG